MPLLSIIMSAYGTARWIAKAIDSVLAQELPADWDLELVIAIDGDREILPVISQAPDVRLTILSLTENGGTYRALNTALAYVQGDYIGVLDSDDIALPQRFLTQCHFLAQHPHIDVLGGQVEIRYDEEQNIIRKMLFHLDPVDAYHTGKDFKAYQVCHGTWIAKRVVYETLGGYADFRTGADTEFILRALASGFVCRSLPEYLIQYRQRDGQITRQPETGYSSAMRSSVIVKIQDDARRYRNGEIPQRLTPVCTPITAAYKFADCYGHLELTDVSIGTA